MVQVKYINLVEQFMVEIQIQIKINIRNTFFFF